MRGLFADSNAIKSLTALEGKGVGCGVFLRKIDSKPSHPAYRPPSPTDSREKAWNRQNFKTDRPSRENGTRHGYSVGGETNRTDETQRGH